MMKTFIFKINLKFDIRALPGGRRDSRSSNLMKRMTRRAYLARMCMLDRVIRVGAELVLDLLKNDISGETGSNCESLLYFD